MKYLIDTHIFLWSLFSPQKIFKDPFDRMIIWQAIRENMVLISKDSEMSSYEKYGLNILSNQFIPT